MFSLVVVYNFESTYYEGKSMAGFFDIYHGGKPAGRAQ